MPRRFAPRNDMLKLAACPHNTRALPESVLAPATTPPPSACHCKPVHGAPQRGTLCGERSHKGALLLRWPSGGGEHGGLWGDEVWQSVFPAGKPSKLALLWANSLRLAYSPKAVLLVLPHCKENGLSRRHAPRNDMQRLAGLLRVQPRPPRAAYHPAKTGAAPHDFGKSC